MSAGRTVSVIAHGPALTCRSGMRWKGTLLTLPASASARALAPRAEAGSHRAVAQERRPAGCLLPAYSPSQAMTRPRVAGQPAYWHARRTPPKRRRLPVAVAGMAWPGQTRDRSGVGCQAPRHSACRLAGARVARRSRCRGARR